MKKLIVEILALAMLAGCGSASTASSGTSASVSAQVTAEAHSYTGIGTGHNGDVKVDVAFADDGKITAVSIGNNSETEPIAKYAFEELPQKIVDAQSTNVDSISGATFTSNAIKDAVADAIKQAGYDSNSYSTEPIASPTDQELSADIVIVGGGGAGLSAAVEAANTGANVILVEANAYVGGSTLYSGGMVLNAASEEEKTEHKALDADDLESALSAWGSEYFNADLTRAWLAQSKENLNWLRENYTGSEKIIDTYDAGYVPMSPNETEINHTLAIVMSETEHDTMSDVQGMWIIDTLHEMAVKNGAQIITNMTADKLLTDDTGAIEGIHATAPDGSTLTVDAPIVILACGGYGGNAEMKKKYTETDGPYFGPTSNQGWGVTAGESVGAKTEFAILPDTGGDYGSYVYSTIGGLVINQNSQVLNENNEVIPNLFAAGELTCVQALDPRHFSSGENNSWAIYTGRIAGKQAAASVK